MSLGLRLQCKGDFVRCLEGNRQQKCRFTSDINCFIRLAAFVKEKAPGDDQSMKLRWIQFVRLSFAVYANQLGTCLVTKQATHNNAQNSAETFEI
jgi:hypothetical protein